MTTTRPVTAPPGPVPVRPAQPLRVPLSELDDIDRRLIVMVACHRDTTRTGPTWRELRKPFGDLLAVRLNGTDPLGARLGRLRWAGAIRFDQTPRSVDITDTVRAALDRRGDAPTAMPNRGTPCG